MPAAKPIRIPYDSLTLAAVVAELQAYVGGKLQRISQPDADTLGLGIYAAGKEAYLLLSCHPQFARAYLSTRRPSNPSQPPQLCAAMRARLDGAKVAAIRQENFDRVLRID